MFELGHSQVGDRDEVLDAPESSGGGFGLLELAVHQNDIRQCLLTIQCASPIVN